MAFNFTLPLLEQVLEELRSGETIALARKQIEQLFGVNDTGAGRLARFAKAHDCMIAHADSCVVFEKRPALVG